MEDTLTQFMQMSMANQKSNEASIKNLETQVGQLAKQLAEQQLGSSFSANTQTNPKEHCKAIVTRSGKEVGGGEENDNRVDDVRSDEIVEEKQKDEVEVEKNDEEKLVENGT